MTNAQFAENITLFQEACRNANTAITTRQASKWRNQKGSAYAKHITYHSLTGK